MRNVGIDALKVLSCFGVVVLHVAGLNATTSNHFIFENIYYYAATFSIPIFFMVNGYLLLNKKELNYKYIFKKLIGILKIVIAWNTLMFVAMLLVKHNLINPFKESLGSLIQKGYFFQFWFFGSLIIIYLCLPLIFRVFKTTRYAILLLIGCFLVCITIDIISLVYEYPMQSYVIQTFRLWTWFMYYFLGGILGKKSIIYYITNKISIVFLSAILILLSVLTILYEIYVAHIIYQYPWAEYFYDNIIVILLVMSLFIFVTRINYDRISTLVIEFISPHIMGIYIIHATFIKGFNHYYPFNSVIMNIILIVLVFGCSLFFSIILSRIPYLRKIIQF
ncbi:hypothetical protein EWI07_03990 [Sporolactobacillus sp. THM7-4]|nr:hypothetical protein EWI07_03990 [Sporolactobacillus sp. THM7-4]